MKKYLVNTPDLIKEFWRKREQEIYAEERRLKQLIHDSNVVLTSDGSLQHPVSNLWYQVGVGYPVQLNISLQCMFRSQSIFILFTPNDNILYGKSATHIIMRTELVYGMMDVEIVEVEIPLSKVSKEVRRYITNLEKQVT